MSKLHLFVLGSLFLLTGNGQARVGFGLGGYVPFAASIQEETTGERNTFSFDPALTFQYFHPLKTPVSHIFSLDGGWVLHGSNEGEDYSKNTLYVLLDLGYLINSKSAFRFGPGVFLTTIRGAGGTTQRRNGSDTIDAYRPSQIRTARNFSFNLGLEVMVRKDWSFRTQFFIFSPLSSLQRKVSYLLGITYYL